MPPRVLYSGPLSMFGAKAQIAALEKGIDVSVVMVPFDMGRLYDPKHPEVLRINPKRQVPVLVDGAVELFDSTQIFEYFEDLKPDPPLWPRGMASRANARQLEHMSDEVFFPHIIRLMGLQDEPLNPAYVAAVDAAQAYYQAMETRVQQIPGSDPYLAGPFSYADIAFFMAQFFAERMGAVMPPTTPALLQWRDRMIARAAVRAVLGPMCQFLRSVGRPVPTFAQAVP